MPLLLEITDICSEYRLQWLDICCCPLNTEVQII